MSAAAAAMKKMRPPKFPRKAAEKPIDLIKKWKIVRGDLVPELSLSFIVHIYLEFMLLFFSYLGSSDCRQR
jgi:hypothetical protein